MVLLLSVPSPCNRLVLVLGTGALFVEGFVAVTETSVNAGTRSGRSCGTNCCGLHPPAQVCQNRTQIGGFLGGAVGGPSPRVSCWSPTDEIGRAEESGILASSAMGSASSSGSSISMSSRGATRVAPEWCSGGSSEESSGGSSKTEELDYTKGVWQSHLCGR